MLWSYHGKLSLEVAVTAGNPLQVSEKHAKHFLRKFNQIWLFEKKDKHLRSQNKQRIGLNQAQQPCLH